ncbi:MAG TPA: PhzF family phenazine biosynthesis protein, partial [Polyangia bacterium]
MAQSFVVVDAFTRSAFAGNPAAVCVLEGAANESWMRAVAREMNLSETAFLAPEGSGFRLRWFTPQVEVDLCGHATLASAHVLWHLGRIPHDQAIVFHTRSGQLGARRRPDGAVELDFPAKPMSKSPAPAHLSRALGVDPKWVGRNDLDYLVELADEATVRSLTPDLAGIASLTARGIIVTARADEGRPYDFVSRFFGPAVGVPEDPVTGSAHCALGPYWAAALGRTDLVGFQASARGGTVGVRLAGDRVALSGHAV